MNRLIPFTALSALGLLLSPTSSQAFSDLDRFEQPAAEGGGGGRYFTGSPLDGYACNVCHAGGPEPVLVIDGLPLSEGFQPGLTYEITVLWANPELQHAFNIELIDRSGHHPNVTLPAPEQVPARDRCNQDPSEPPAASLIDLGNRRVIAVEPCNSGSATFRFTAPEVPDISFALSGVLSDNSASVEGDGTITVTRVLNRDGIIPQATAQTCAASPGSRSRGLVAVFFAAALVLMLRRRRRPVARRLSDS